MIMLISGIIIIMIMNINNDQKQLDGNQHFFVMFMGRRKSTNPARESCL